MKIRNRKAPVLFKKAMTMFKSNTGRVLAARLLTVASLPRRMTTVSVISRKIHTLMVAADQKARGDVFHKVEKMSAIHGGEIVDLSHRLAMFDQEENGASGSSDWTLDLIFNEENHFCSYAEDYKEDCNEPSVMDVIRSNRELEGLEFNMDDEVDQAAEMFIRRFRQRLNTSF